MDYAGTKKELNQRICEYLMDLNSLDKANENRKDVEEDAIEDDNNEEANKKETGKS